MIDLDIPAAADMHALGERLAAVLRAGDLVLLGGELGAGKTTLAQGVGAGLGVRGPVTSPTFVIARVHPSLVDGPPLVHVDAYRLGGWDELEDIDLEATLDEAVTVVEWGEGLAEGLAGDRLEIHIDRSAHAPDQRDGTGKTNSVEETNSAGETNDADEADDANGPDSAHGTDDADGPIDRRRVRITGVGVRWDGVELRTALSV